jgi:basic membrane protein A
VREGRSPWGAALLVGLLLAASACTGGTKASPTPTGSAQLGGRRAFLACLLSDPGGIHDRSINELSWRGLLDARQDLGVQISYRGSATSEDYQPNIEAFEHDGCDLIVGVGALLSGPVADAALAEPSQRFALVDATPGRRLPNVLPLTFDPSQAAFLAGYLAAGVTMTGKVGEFGSLDLPSVRALTDAFAAGVLYHNRLKATAVRVLGWNPTTHAATFAGDPLSGDAGRRAADALLDEGADVVFAPPGPIAEGAAAAVQARDGLRRLIFSDTDGCVALPQDCSFILTTVEKNYDVAVEAAVREAIHGGFRGGRPYVGTLRNGGVGLAPFRLLRLPVPPEVQDQLKVIAQHVIDGSVSLDPLKYV